MTAGGGMVTSRVGWMKGIGGVMASARRDCFIGIVLLVFSAVFFFFSFSFTQSALQAEAQHVGPAFMPRILLVTLAILSLALTFSGIVRMRRANRHQPQKTASFDARPMVMFLAFACYAYMATLLGFVSTTLLFLMISFYMLGFRKLWQILVLAPLITAVVYYLFSNLLNVWLPEGLWL